MAVTNVKNEWDLIDYAVLAHVDADPASFLGGLEVGLRLSKDHPAVAAELYTIVTGPVGGMPVLPLDNDLAALGVK